MQLFDLEIEERNKLGLSSQVLAAVGWKPGDRVRVQVRRDGRLAIMAMADVLDRYAGAVPGLSQATALTRARAE
jgi:hypothetical protein